ncbi:MAG: hypothetical protein HKN53_08130 [Maribacter sp.]|nr:hypothetical protein [Maribacter sp.]
MEKEIIKEYVKGDLTILWKPKKCIHAGTCVKTLPNVYDPKGKPWIKPEHASIAELKAQIDECPSAALSYIMKDNIKNQENSSSMTKINIKPNGPILVQGTIVITDQDGVEHKKEKTTALCRCGASGNKPFCDGEHNRIGWKDS